MSTSTFTGALSFVPTPAPSASATSSMDSEASKSVASAAMSSLSAVIASASAALSSESAIASGQEANPPVFKYVGLALAVGSGVLIGSSFVFKKKGLLAAQKKYETAAGEGHAYLKSPMWWTGMIVMVFGEVFNFVAYAFADAVLVTPLGALSVVICAILSSIFLKEKLTLFGKIGCFLCIVGSVIIAINAPTHHAGGKITEFQKLFLAPGFLTWASVCIAASLVLVFFFAPKYGKKHMLIYITVCSLIGGLSVSVTSGLGSAILLSIRGQNQFKHWFIYFLLGFVIVTLLVEINYLNKALELFNTATVTPTYYVIFTGATLITSIILQQGLDATPMAIVTLVMGFLVICAGICLLQLSKIDPEELQDQPGLDRNTTLLIRASHSVISHKEKGDTSVLEDPGVDTVRGGLGVVGSMIRARSSRRISSASSYKRGHYSAADEYTLRSRNNLPLSTHGSGDIERYQLQDAPLSSMTLPVGMPSRRETTISFASGSDEPHGHHAVHHTVPPERTHSLGAIREASAGSESYQGGAGPTIIPVLPRSGATDNIRTMWDEPATIQASPSDELDDYSLKTTTTRDEIKGEKVNRSYPRGKNAESDGEEEEELLSPRLYNK